MMNMSHRVDDKFNMSDNIQTMTFSKNVIKIFILSNNYIIILYLAMIEIIVPSFIFSHRC